MISAFVGLIIRLAVSTATSHTFAAFGATFVFIKSWYAVSALTTASFADFPVSTTASFTALPAPTTLSIAWFIKSNAIIIMDYE